MSVSGIENIASSGGKISFLGKTYNASSNAGNVLVSRRQVEALIDRLTKLWYATTKFISLS
jgi:hypothetical protein